MVCKYDKGNKYKMDNENTWYKNMINTTNLLYHKAKYNLSLLAY